MTHTERDQLLDKISDLCLQEGLSYDRTLPVPVSPGVWMFHATPMNESCRKMGKCRQSAYYAVQYNSKFVLS